MTTNFRLAFSSVSWCWLSYLGALLPGPSRDVEAVHFGGQGRAVDVVGGDLDVVERVIVAGHQGVPAVVGQAVALAVAVTVTVTVAVTHHNSLLPEPASRLGLELKVDNLSIQVWSLVSCLQAPSGPGGVKNPKSKHNSISAL